MTKEKVILENVIFRLDLLIFRTEKLFLSKLIIHLNLPHESPRPLVKTA